MSDNQAKLHFLFILWNFGYAHSSENLWCYGCNTNLTEGRSQECNDPYAPGPMVDLIQCPQNESHHCLKSIIVYHSILTTVRGCVPSTKVNSYCDINKYPDAKIDCYFCSVYACNHSDLLSSNFLTIISMISVLLWKCSALWAF
ncbi:uncharacterized protein LOC117181171 [Belonocnema kinseyi]|uniref:uncharacterized protein LOC117181171 n=1 Tax=Belonocnema kinseyi TaxID=2817044 RepID=UPI00143DD624|nr:uncharacterized protein LOC117181171 [Belonocnema kinseyi]